MSVFALRGTKDGEVGGVFRAPGPVFRLRLIGDGDAFGVEALEFVRLGPLSRFVCAAEVDAGLAVRAMGWGALGSINRCRSIFRQLICPVPVLSYQRWLPTAKTAARRTGAGGKGGATTDCISLLVLAPGGDKAALARTIESCLAQICPPFEIVVAGAAAAGVSAAHPAIRLVPCDGDAQVSVALCALAAAAQGAYAGCLFAGDLLPPDALEKAAAAIAAAASPAVVYGDDDLIDQRGVRAAPRFKPDWNEEFFFAQNYVGDFFLLPRQRLLDALSAPEIPPGCELPYVFLRAAADVGDRNVVHVDSIMCHRYAPRVAAHSGREGAEHHARLVARFLRERKSPATVELDEKAAVRVRHALPAMLPSVCAIVPTRDRVELLSSCVASLLARTRYSRLQIVIADNGSREAATLRYFDTLRSDPRVRILDCAGPFNFSTIINTAVRQTDSDLLAFINNDVEARDAEWLEEMVAHAVRRPVGAVGAKLLYPDGTIQHAGVVVGLGPVAGHPYRGYPESHPGYMARLASPQWLTAVTAACLVMSRDKFNEVGGFDEEAFPVTLNDIDLCLKLMAAGYHNVYTPHATLWHHESATRESDFWFKNRRRLRREVKLFRERWAPVIARDPHYNVNLTRRNESVALR